jgi:membrane protein implicated in regulation of membrane protease activity
MPTYVFWFVAALALLVVELHSATFYAIFLAAGAFAAGLLAFFVPDSQVWIQAVLTLVVAMGGVVVVRPWLGPRLRRRGEPPLTPGVHGGFVGQTALALDAIGDQLHPGHVRFAGETWMAFSDGRHIADGDPVIVTAVRGTTLEVRPASGSVTSES